MCVCVCVCVCECLCVFACVCACARAWVSATHVRVDMKSQAAVLVAGVQQPHVPPDLKVCCTVRDKERGERVCGV